MTGMRVERDCLWKTAVPQLRQFCAERCLTFLLIDLSWDLHHTAPHQSTSAAAAAWNKSLRLNEILRCQTQSVGPAFVVCIFTQRRAVAKNVGRFRRRLFVCLFVSTMTYERVNIGR